MQIYLARDNVQAGPYGLDELNTMLQSGEVQASDLMWHVGMDNWQSVGQMTGGALHYQPGQPPHQPPSAPTDQLPRQTFSQVYGNAAPSNSAQNDAAQNNATPVAPPSKTTSAEEWQGRHSLPQDTSPMQASDIVFASPLSRILATLINLGLFFAATLPLQRAIANSGIDLEELQIKDSAQYFALGERLNAVIPSVTVDATFAMLAALALVQLLMLLQRGQSLGKLAVGIRVVDEKTHRLSMWHIMMRFFIVLLFYFVVLFLFSPLLAVGLFVINCVMVSTGSKRQGWHDYPAKTVVLKANPKQLVKLDQS